MTRLATKKFRVHLAQQLQESISEAAPSQYYVFLSGVSPWPNEISPPAPVDTVQFSDYDIWRGIIGLKKVSNNDVSLAVNRYTWANNIGYAQYSNLDPDLYSRIFFVITDEDNVYKCLLNNRGANSTVKPTGTSTSTITTSDGYKWKFLYNVTGADKLKYLTENFIPVKTLLSNDSSAQWTVQQAAANGSVLVYDVTANGTGYLTNSGTIREVTNSTFFSVATSAAGTDNIYNGSTIYITSGLGAGQIRDIVKYFGTNKQLSVNTPFTVVPNTASTYLIGPKINITGDGTGALAYANVSGGQITKVTAINIGSNYSKTLVTVTANSSHGSGATVVGYLSPPGGHGSDPVNELGGSNITLNVKIDGSESDKIAANNNFRVFGLLKDPLLSSGSVATNLRFDQTLRLTLNFVSGTYSEDEFVTGSTSGARGRMVSFANTNSAGNNGILRLVNVDGNFTNTETVTANTSGITAVINGITQPELKPYSGKLLYVVNRVAIDRDTEQTEDIKITVKF